MDIKSYDNSSSSLILQKYGWAETAWVIVNLLVPKETFETERVSSQRSDFLILSSC